MALAPTLPDETRGLIGTFGADRVCRVFLVASKRDAREVLRAAARLSASSADNGALAVAMFERSLLEETSAVPVLELDAAPAAWLVGWYSLYRRETGNIR